MKKYFIFLLSWPLFAGLNNLDINRAISMLENNNLELKISHFNEQMKAYEATAAKGHNYGKLDVTAAAMRSNDAGNVFGFKLQSREATFNDFGFLVSINILDYDAILKEYDSNVGNKLLKLVSDYMLEYMQENHLKFEIVRYSEDNFLIFIDKLNEEKIEEHIVNIQKSMSNYRFKHRHKVFNLTFYFAVMQYIKNESFTSVLDQLDEKLFLNKL